MESILTSYIFNARLIDISIQGGHKATSPTYELLAVVPPKQSKININYCNLKICVPDCDSLLVKSSRGSL